jgi:protein-tyrosine kinase
MNDRLQILDREHMLTQSTKMGPMLVAMGKLNPKDLNMILATQKKHGLRFGDAAQQLGLVSADDINAILAEQFAYTRTPAASSKLDHRLSALFQPDTTQAEALRSLRSELMLRYFNSQPHSALALVSAENAQNIALTTANLAISFAQLGLRTLLIDSNLRAPQLNTLFNLHEHAPGLSDWIAERTSVAPTAIESVRSLWVLPAGTRAPNPQELLSSKHYQERVNPLIQHFDITLISTAPMDSNRDAQLVAAQAGAAVLIAQQHVTHTKALVAIGNRLRELGVRLVGTTLLG